MLIDLAKSKHVSIDEVGGKAFNLHKLTQMGMPVPAAVVVPASVCAGLDDTLLAQLRNEVLGHETILSGELFAVRSSGVGEDSIGNSCAGIFESRLNVPKEEIHDAVAHVWRSLKGPRSLMYAQERAIFINSMGVVIQHMVDAEYAGVIFTICPIEKDARVALLEVVQGNGDSLVSGKKTPATLRINKITGITRISRNGADEIPEHTLEAITEMIMPLITTIEAEYKMPMDIEWAIAEGKPRILQARPITT